MVQLIKTIIGVIMILGGIIYVVSLSMKIYAALVCTNKTIGLLVKVERDEAGRTSPVYKYKVNGKEYFATTDTIIKIEVNGAQPKYPKKRVIYINPKDASVYYIKGSYEVVRNAIFICIYMFLITSGVNLIKG